jgi:peptidoglycan L-alanyl-D-glutamate endopeptidase CwlK
MNAKTTCRDISQLTANAQKACNLFLEECKSQGLKVLITETYRSQERQNYLYAQGRTAKGQIVTWTKQSRHTSRRAWDICQNVKGQEYSNTTFFRRCGEIARSLGIVWGGDWASPDMPHFEVDASWSYEGDMPMTKTERIKFNMLVEQVDKLTREKEKVYHYTKELPDYARQTIQKLLNKGIYSGASESDLNLPETLMRVLVINDRAGLYD